MPDTTKYLRVSRGHEWLIFEDEPTWWNPYEVTGNQNLIYSEPHTRHGHVWDSGGPFDCIKCLYSETSTLPKEALMTSNGGTYRYRGDLFAHRANVGSSSSLWPVVNPSPDFILVPMGATAISRVVPTNPTSNLAQFFGELREGLPSRVGSDFFKSRSQLARSAGSEYLNVEFGWKPLINDVRSFADSVTNSHRILSKYERQSGIKIKRRYHFPTTVEEEEEDLGLDVPDPALATPIFRVFRGPKHQKVVTTTERWFSGCFTYYLPPTNVGGRRSWFQKANKLLGTRLTPEVLWNLAPWSWASDWFANTGDVLKNISAFSHDGLVMRYGYMMEQITSSRIITLDGIEIANIPGTQSFSQTWTTKSMRRIEASPYGFGVAADWLNFLSDRQLSIMAALGLQAKRGH